jgi:glycerol-3-phosphate dehydrogenase
MFIWGGLLYLRKLEFASVAMYCRARDRMARDFPEWVRVCPMRYVAMRGDRRGPAFLLAGLYLYWLLGAFRRSRPRLEADCSERARLRADRFWTSLAYEEASVLPSDARLVLQLILSRRGPGHVALNHCALVGGAYDRAARAWRLELADRLDGREVTAKARLVVNAAGVWTEEINRQFGIASRYKHVLGKGVFIGIPRDPIFSRSLIMETKDDQDCMSLIPWGPIALWGPTETVASDLETAFRPEPEDVRLLLDELNRHLVRPAAARDIVSLRCGVRPLAVDRDFSPGPSTLDLSKRAYVEPDRGLPWVSLYGGKITGCMEVARGAARAVRAILGAPTEAAPETSQPPPPEWKAFPGLAAPVVSAGYSAEHEWCWTLEDYLRRRTNIAQWVPRGGLGREDEHVPHLREIARHFTGGEEAAAQEAVEAYRKKVDREFDRVLAACGG